MIASFIVAAQRCESLLFLLRVFVGIRWWGAREEKEAEEIDGDEESE